MTNLPDKINEWADVLYNVAGLITMTSKCDKTAVTAGCECRSCVALVLVHNCMNEMERVIKELSK